MSGGSPVSGNESMSLREKPPIKAVDVPAINLSPHSVEDPPSSPESQDEMNLPEFFRVAELPQQQKSERLESEQLATPQQQQQQQQCRQRERRSWKDSMIASWKNRTGGSNVDASDRTTGTENSPEGDSEHTCDASAVSTATVVNYDDLLALPLEKISFVVVNDRKKNSSITKCIDEKEQAGDEKKVESVDNVQTAPEESNTKEPSIGDFLGVDLVKNPTNKRFEIKEHVFGGPAPILSPQLAVLLLPGDVLESVNGVPCRRSRDVDELYQKIVQQQQEKETMTLTFVCRPTPSELSGSLHREQSQSKQHTVHQVTLITGNSQVTDKKEETQSGNDANTETAQSVSPADNQEEPSTSTPSSQPPLPEWLKLKMINKERPNENRTLLHLESIPSQTFLHHACARSNDLVLSIDNTPCYDMSPEEVNRLFQTMVQSPRPFVNLKFHTVPLTRAESIRRGAVAAAGGTMVGAGAIMMATPLHPIGHAMTIGGLGVLGTEFEGPKRAFNKMGSVFKRMSSQNTEQEQKEEDQTQDPYQKDEREEQNQKEATQGQSQKSYLEQAPSLESEEA